MSSLTEQERLGLDEVFLSISSNRKKFPKLSTLRDNISHYLTLERIRHSVSKPARMLASAQKRIKITNFSHLFPKNKKKKKNLS